ncbi:putative Choline transport protein [Seiridium unicorne]|uniref:Choline transport protein n=1 Tax=Seiridium unicorne TaxID=138068 RepID=A0ABR2V0Q6_9PEZI
MDNHESDNSKIEKNIREHGYDEDALDLAALGHEQALARKFSIWSMLALSFCVLGTWSTFAQGLSSGLTNGGPIAILWGLVLVLFCNICVAVSLGELVSAMPTTLGQAFWISHLWPTRLGRFCSYMCAWINTFGWWTLCASQNAFMTDFILGMKLLFDPDWEGGGTGWLEFLVFIGITALMSIINMVCCRRDSILPTFNNVVGVTFIGLFFVISLALLISVGTKDNLEFQPADFIFGAWLNQTGWSDGVTWFMGLLQAAYGLTAFDSAIHMVEEIPHPRTNIPKIIWLSVLCGALTGFIFMVVCLASIQSLDDILDPVTGLPFMDLLSSVLGVNGGCVLLSIFIFNGIGQGVSIVTSGSRLTWGFARDGGLPWSNYLAHVNETWKAPLRAIVAQGIVISLVGVLYTFSSTVLEAILSVSTIALTISYGLPIITLLSVGRDKLPPGPFKLGKFGPTINWIAAIYCCITTVFFFFPGSPDPAPEDMNYAIAVFGIMLIVAVGFWFFKGRSSFMQIESIDGCVPALRGGGIDEAKRTHLESSDLVTKN